MALRLVAIQGKKAAWAEEAATELADKIGKIVKFERVLLKSPSKDRDSADEKRRAEEEILQKKLGSGGIVVLFDEKGRGFKNSHDFSTELVKLLSRQQGVSLVIGGPYGFTDGFKKRATALWSLSPLTMNHHVAHVAALEQIYRALTIWKNLPYHN